MMMIAPNSRRCREKKRGSKEEFEVKRRGMLATGEWSDPIRKMSHHEKGLIGEGNGIFRRRTVRRKKMLVSVRLT